MSITTIAIDAMSGDYGLSTVIPAVLAQLKNEPQLAFILVGDPLLIEEYLQQASVCPSERLRIWPASQVVFMDESPTGALRNKKDSSLRVAIDLVHQGLAQAVVSAGNTGALMATARYVLKMLSQIERPALMATLPTENEQGVTLLDLGANVDCTPLQLLQFALMACVYLQVIENKANPSVGLLNIGVEETKGNELVKAANRLFTECTYLNYVGYVEADSLFKGATDIVVCDGFVGNSVLKASEGVAKLVIEVLKASFSRNTLNKIRGLLAKPALNVLKSKIDPDIHNGSCLLGLNGIVIKSHGSANAHAFEFAIQKAKLAVSQKLSEKIGQLLATLN
jgi:glycerol-3-phosphate acyltransferase PlsX